jgi:hemerythrin
MNLIEWKDEFSVGVPSIDYEHKQLIELINQLNEMAQWGNSYDNVIDALGEIHVQISAHFALEEKIMRDLRYDDYAGHKADHENLLDELRDIMDQVDDDGGYDESRLGDELNRWFSVHFGTHDARLHQRIAK